ncbi:unnamed protein product [Diabrotica balteata]|uniref:Uncharacterized protein n=1 Tax=Diabrotica balteata TaxID=107213 RepID=A0A9N9TA34_DIABA|nr:unnamed protein product [Diabrotica balteata]
MHLLAERNKKAIARELKLYKDKIAAMTSEIDDVKSDQQMGQDAKSILEARMKELEEQLAELQYKILAKLQKKPMQKFCSSLAKLL